MGSDKDILMKPGDLAQEIGILPSRISYYTSLGLLSVGDYTDGGQKLYPRNETMVQLKRIEKLNNRGLHLDEIHTRIGKNRRDKRILVIDDEPSVGELVKDLLADRLKATVDIALDGFAAGLTLQEHFPDLIILDLNLPGINGFEVCKRIRQDELHSGVRILAVTGYDTDENYARIISEGADDYCAKPLQAEELFQKISALLNHKKIRRQK